MTAGGIATIPTELETAVYDAARAVLGPGPLATGALVRAITDRSRRYTSDRDQLASPVDATADLAARAVFFTVADAVKVAVPIGELVNRGALPAARPLRVVDLGAGCGAMSLGLIAALDPTIALELVLVDRDTRALAIASAAIRGFAAARGTTVAVTMRTADVTAAATAVPPAELVLAGTVLNELPADAQLAVVERALTAVAPDGALIIVEPALRDTARALHELRDAVLTRGAAHVFAPCTRTCAPCPALADPDDWCHEHRTIALSPRTAELARLTHLRDSGLKFAYLVLRHAALALVDAHSADAWRVVSAPFPAKGKVELFGCSDHGRATIRLLRRHRTPVTRAVERADRGDVLVIGSAPLDGRVEVTADTAVVRVTPADR